MRSITQEARANMAKRRNFVNYARMTLADGTVLNLEPKDFRVAGNSFTDDLVSGDNFQFGTVIGKTVNIRLDNTDERFSQYDFYMARFTLYLHFPEAYTDEHGDLQDEIFTLGLFTVTEPSTTGIVIDIAGIDEIYKFDKSFGLSNFNLTVNHSLHDILVQCCNECDVAIGFNHFDNENLVVKLEEQPKSKTYREIVSEVCTIAGCNARVNATGALELVWYNSDAFSEGLDGGTFNYPGQTSYEDGDTADGGSFNPWNVGYVYDSGEFTDRWTFHHISNIKGLKILTDDTVFTGVKIANGEDTTYYPTSGYEGYVIEIKDNPFTIGNEALIAQQLYNKLQRLIIRGFSCSILQDPTIEAGDACMIWDIKNIPHKSLITNVKYTVGGMMQISCNVKNPIAQVTSHKDKVAQAIQESENYSDNKLNAYGNAVAHFNELANAALGYYKTDVMEQGATITYIHDKPTLAASTNIWKISATGIQISEDGGQTYTSGVDTVNAELIMNMVYAHGVSCDWIHSGTLVLGGDNNVNGKIEMKDSSGNTIGTWDYTGLEVAKGSMRGLSMDLGGPLGDTSYGELKLYDVQGNPFAVFNQDGILCKSGPIKVGLDGILVTDLKYGEVDDWSAYNTYGHDWANLKHDQLMFTNYKYTQGYSQNCMIHCGDQGELKLRGANLYNHYVDIEGKLRICSWPNEYSSSTSEYTELCRVEGVAWTDGGSRTDVIVAGSLDVGSRGRLYVDIDDYITMIGHGEVDIHSSNDDLYLGADGYVKIENGESKTVYYMGDDGNSHEMRFKYGVMIYHD